MKISFSTRYTILNLHHHSYRLCTISSTSETSNITITRPRKITQNRQKNYPLRFGIARRFELLQRITEERLLCLLRQRNIWENYSGIYTPYIFTVMKRKGRRAVSNVCSGQERERERWYPPPNFRYRRAVENLLFRVHGERGGPCATHVHFNAITASSLVRGSKWPP